MKRSTFLLSAFIVAIATLSLGLASERVASSSAQLGCDHEALDAGKEEFKRVTSGNS